MDGPCEREGAMISRRTFLKGAIAAGVCGPGMAFGEEEPYAPASLVNCRSAIIRNVYGWLQDQKYGTAKDRLDGQGEDNTDVVGLSEMLNEPAFEIAANMHDWYSPYASIQRPDKIYSILEKVSPALKRFNEGLANFVSFHLDGSVTESREALNAEIEKRFALSLFTAINFNPEEAEVRTRKYQESTWEQKKEQLMKLFGEYKVLAKERRMEGLVLEGYSRRTTYTEGDTWNQFHPQHPYNRLLVASHSFKWLGDQYAFNSNFKINALSKMSDFVYHEIEKPFRALAPKIRARNKIKYFNESV